MWSERCGGLKDDFKYWMMSFIIGRMIRFFIMRRYVGSSRFRGKIEIFGLEMDSKCYF